MNFFISNGVVLEAAYWQEGRPQSTRRKDEAAGAILKRLFPDREIVQIHSENLNYGGGGMQCTVRHSNNRQLPVWALVELKSVKG